MKSRDEILATLREMKPYLREKYHVEQLWLFGSVARGEQTEDSDVDLLYTLNGPLGWHIVSLGDELEAALESKVDLVSRDYVRPTFWPYIAEDIVDV